MRYLKQFIRMVVVTVLIVLSLILTDIFLYVLSPFGGYHVLFEGLVAGFGFFLHDNLPAMSFDVGTWGPGLGAFLLAMMFGHRFLKAWAARTNRHWSLATSFCLALILPVLFVISFIVPGVLLQWEMLRQVAWLDVR